MGLQWRPEPVHTGNSFVIAVCMEIGSAIAFDNFQIQMLIMAGIVTVKDITLAEIFSWLVPQIVNMIYLSIQDFIGQVSMILFYLSVLCMNSYIGIPIGEVGKAS